MATVKTRPERSAPRRGRYRARSAREWRVTSLTGIALLVLLTMHMVANHFVIDSVGGLRDYDQVLDYIANPAMFTIESLFLLFVTVHAMLGVRGVLYDLDPGPRLRRWIDIGLVTLGLVTLAYGYFLIGTLASRA
jgi:succinate dehydrogenase hydrophobic anchor subunit